jgi:FkbM family methyltransferase
VGLNYWVGSTMTTLRDEALVRRLPGLWSRYPRGQVLTLDVARLAGSQPVRMVFDVGANQGQTAAEFSRWFPGATVHSFEPVAANYSELAREAARLPNVVPHHAACGADEGSLFIRYGVHHHLHSLAGAGARADEAVEGKDGETVMVMTVDAVCESEGIAQVDLLKTDTEGYDLEVLKGAARMLARGSIRFIAAEAGLNGQTGQTPFCELQKTLLDADFVFSGFYDPMRGGVRKEILWFCNALFTHRSVVAS